MLQRITHNTGRYMRRQYTKAHRNFPFIKMIIFMAQTYKVFFEFNSGNILLLLAFIKEHKFSKQYAPE